MFAMQIAGGADLADVWNFSGWPIEQAAGVTDIAGGLAALDRGQDRLQQGVKVLVRPAVAPETGKVCCGAQLKQASVLASRNADGLGEAGLRARAVRHGLPQRELPAQAVQIGEPVLFAGLFDEGKCVREVGL